MSTDIYLVTVGAYTDYHVVRAFGDESTAQQWAKDYNNTNPWRHTDDKARVETVSFTPARHNPPKP